MCPLWKMKIEVDLFNFLSSSVRTTRSARLQTDALFALVFFTRLVEILDWHHQNLWKMELDNKSLVCFCTLCGLCTFLKMNTGSVVWVRVTVLSNRQIMNGTNVAGRGVTVNLYRFIDPSLFVSFWFTSALTQVLCPLWVINISWSQQQASIFKGDWGGFTASFPFVWLASSFDWICFVPLVWGNLAHRHGPGLLCPPSHSWKRLFAVKISI